MSASRRELGLAVLHATLHVPLRRIFDLLTIDRVAAKIPKGVISSVVPGIKSDVDVKFWVDQAESHQLMRVWMQVPPSQPNEGAVMLELALSKQNVPVR